jgi:hypothetical protein
VQQCIADGVVWAPVQRRIGDPQSAVRVRANSGSWIPTSGIWVALAPGCGSSVCARCCSALPLVGRLDSVRRVGPRFAPGVGRPSRSWVGWSSPGAFCLVGGGAFGVLGPALGLPCAPPSRSSPWAGVFPTRRVWLVLPGRVVGRRVGRLCASWCAGPPWGPGFLGCVRGFSCWCGLTPIPDWGFQVSWRWRARRCSSSVSRSSTSAPFSMSL